MMSQSVVCFTNLSYLSSLFPGAAAVRVATIAHDIGGLGFALAIRAAVLAPFLRLAMTTGMSTLCRFGHVNPPMVGSATDCRRFQKLAKREELADERCDGPRLRTLVTLLLPAVFSSAKIGALCDKNGLRGA